MEVYLQSAKSGKKKAGQTFLIKYLTGDKITRKQSMDARCYECQGMGDSDKCEITQCPLFPYSKFNHSNRKKGKPNNEEQ